MAESQGTVLRGNILTQLVGAICENGKKIVTVSDRMVSASDMTLTFEPQRIKAEILTEKTVVLTAGTTGEPGLFDVVRSKIVSGGAQTVVEIADIIKDCYQDIREKHIIDEILKPQLGIGSFQEWQQVQASLHDGIVMDVDNLIKKYRVGLTLLLAGMDGTGHLYGIGDPGAYRSFDTVAYCCVGMGESHANSVFAWFKYGRHFSLNSAIYTSFTAKKRAETAGGVGQTTDILILSKDGIEEVKEETVNELEKIYATREENWGTSELDGDIKSLELQTSKMAHPES